MIIKIMMTDSATVSALQKMIPRKSLTLLECQFTCFACTDIGYSPSSYPLESNYSSVTPR